MKPSTTAVPVGVTVAGMTLALLLLEILPGIPYNVKEIVADRNPVLQGVLLSCLLYLLFGIPALTARLAQRNHYLILSLPLLLVLETGVLWIFLRIAVPAESIHDILGTPVLAWPWEWEYLFRLSGLVIGAGTMLTGASILSAAITDSKSDNGHRTLLLWAALSLPMLALAHWIIVDRAATDNLTELMTGGGGPQATLFIAAWLATVGLTGSILSARFARGRPQALSVILLVLVSSPVAYGCLMLGLEQEVHKYRQVFSALQFLLSTDRSNLAGTQELLVRFLIAHYGMVALVAVFQYPVWAYRLRPQTHPARHRSHHMARRWPDRFPPGLAAPLAYGCLVIYGTLYPFEDWQVPREGSLAGVLSAWPAHISLADVLTNSVVYLPFGYLLARSLRRRFSTVRSIGLAGTAALLLSWTLEYLQYSIPFRNTSSLDLGLNVLGAVAGAAIAMVAAPQHALGLRLRSLRQAWFLPDRGSSIALAVTGLWLLAATFPFVPSIDIGNLRQGLAPLWAAVQQPALISLPRIAAGTLSFFGVGQLLMLAAISASRIRDAYVMLLVLVVLLAVPIMERALDAETLVALPAAVLLLYSLASRDPKRGPVLAFTAIVAAYLAQNLSVPAGADEAPVAAFTWMPFSAHMGNIIPGLADILDNSWPFAALAYLVWYRSGGRFYRTPALGAGLVFLVVLAINLLQQFIPGRYPDITDAIVATTAWLATWHVLRNRRAPAATGQGPAADNTQTQPENRYDTACLLACALLALPLAGFLLGAVVSLGSAHGPPPHTLPAPGGLPPAPLTDYNYEHPRLPAPTANDIATLRSLNPAYLRRLSSRTTEGSGKVDAIVTMAYIEPGSQNLDSLLERLLGIEFRQRASGEVKDVVLAYDWLYRQWDPQQLAKLRAKVADGCEHLIGYIREESLSPYNVILYNTLLQDLLACAIVIYGDDERGEPVMAFAYDLLINRTLPVWRQVMGENGGWHEGGEYVALGIGKAVYQIPAMWRKATGVDLFRTEPGIRGFLDFLVYRTRPDKTHIRWGDGSHFDRRVPDRIALALEYRHAPAYSLNGCPAYVRPTAWPWGPLTDDSLCDPDAVKRLPLARYFDGIGMLVARSDWTPDAIFTSFKAGDNYWSHTHLDQGAFTVFQNGPLAIDSGAYGGGGHYGSDHHMNYAYQTIAHNSLSVLDPQDTVPAPRDDAPPRPIANDGGQRRIGSGWGIEAAPLDLDEWMQKRDIYHTGTMKKVFLADELAIAVADLTAAYTNSESGKGTFSHRTRRVERFIRTFGFDQATGAILIFDRVVSSNPAFRKRWLHHSMQKPSLTAYGYTVTAPTGERPPETAASRLDVHVLLPRNPDITLVGGAGFEFYVDGTNYDEDGKTLQVVKRKRPPLEAGNWRVEVSPAVAAKEDVFLVVLLPHKSPGPASHRVRLLEDETRTGCEIEYPGRTVRWWFDNDRQGPMVEVVSGEAGSRTHDLRVGVEADAHGPEPFAADASE